MQGGRNEAAFIFWCHALCKLGRSNFYTFEMKHASGLETTNVYLNFLNYLQPSVIIFNLVILILQFDDVTVKTISVYVVN